MSGNRSGGLKGAAKLKARDPDYFRKMGKVGGSAPRKAPGGFGSSIVGKDGLTGYERARIYGARGGRISKRKPRKEAA